MTEYIFKSSLKEADDIAKGRKKFIFRSNQYPITFGDRFTLQPYKDGKTTRHAIEKMRFVVTYVSGEAPVEKGFNVIGFEPLA